MSDKTLNTIIQIREDTTTNWSSSTLILRSGEPAHDKDLNIYKVGDGVNTWSNLPISAAPYSYQPKIYALTTNTAISTAAKVATLDGYTPAVGDLIALTLTAGNSAASPTLDINSLGAVAIRINNMAANTIVASLTAGAVILLYHDGTYWRMMGSQRTSDSNSNDYDRTYWGNTITAGAAIYDYKLIAQGLDGKFYPLTLETGTGTTKTISTQEFEINTQILYYATTTDVAANATTVNVYSEYPVANLTYTSNQASWTSQQLIYLKATTNAAGNFVLDNSSPTSFMTQTIPTTEDGFVYILLGYMYSATAMRLFQFHPIYKFRDGAFRVHMPVHSHGNITDTGKVGTTSGVPLITGTDGIVQAGSFGNSANTFCEGDDARLSDARTPTAHEHSTYDRATSVLSGANVFSDIIVGKGIVTGVSARALTADNISAAPSSHVGATGAALGAATTLVNGFMSSDDKTKLDSIDPGAASYTLPVATASDLGGVKSGTDISVDETGNVSIVDDSHNHVISNVDGLQTALDGKVDDTQVLTNVPVNAVFTDTITSINGKTGVIVKNDIVALGIPAQDTAYTHPTSGIIAGTYKSVTIDANGHATGGANPTTLLEYGITDAYKIPIIGAVGYFAGSSFSEDATYTDYPYSYKWDVTGPFDLSTMVPQIVFDHACAVSGLFSPVCKLEATGVRIYAKSIPTFNVIVSSCIIWKGLYTKDTSGLGFTNAIGYNNPTITAGTKCKITYSAKGYVTSGEDLSASDIPGLAWSKITSGTPTTLSGYGITDAASSSHVGATGAAHGVATISVDGFMSSTDKTKLNGIAASANNYAHPTGDGNLHVPVTSTTNNGKFLMAGASAGTLSWEEAVNLTAAQTISGAKTFSGVTALTNSTASTSTTTGALKVTGGVGVQGDIYANNVYGAVWNDYAEYRESDETVQLGRVVKDLENDKVGMCSKRLSKACMISSDTFGFSIGNKKDKSVPVAVAGRVLVWTDENRTIYKPGDCVCSGKYGTVSKMKWWEKILFPDRIIGVVSSVPNYEKWGSGDIIVDKRIWVRVR